MAAIIVNGNIAGDTGIREISYAKWQAMSEEDKKKSGMVKIPDYPEILTAADVNEKVEEVKDTLSTKIASDKIKNISIGELTYSCAAGLNKITASSTLISGTFPSKVGNVISIFVNNHSATEGTKDIVTIDGNNIFIHAEKAQNIRVKYLIYE